MDRLIQCVAAHLVLQVIVDQEPYREVGDRAESRHSPALVEPGHSLVPKRLLEAIKVALRESLMGYAVEPLSVQVT